MKNEKGKEKAPYSTQIKADILNDYKYNLRYAQIDINSLKGQIVLPPTKEEIAKYGKKTFNKETTMALLAYLYDSSVPRIVTAAAVADKLDEYVSTKRDEANVWREELHSLELNHVNDNGVSGPRHGIQSLMEKIAHADKIAEAISFYQTALKTNTASNIQDKYYPAIKKDLVEIFHMSGHEVDQLIENHYTLGKVVDASGNVIDTINIHPHSVVNNHEQVGEETEKRIKLDMKKEQEEQQRRKRAEKKGKGSDDQFKAPAPGVQGGQNRAGTPSRGAVAAQ